jgi:hypothetical protein
MLYSTVCRTDQITPPACRQTEYYLYTCMHKADSAGEGWTGEAYEADTLPGGDSSFPKFSKRLQRAPEQCIRYRSVPQPTVSRLDVHKRQTPRPPSSVPPPLCFLLAALVATSCGHNRSLHSRRRAVRAVQRGCSSCRRCQRCTRRWARACSGKVPVRAAVVMAAVASSASMPGAG